MWEVSRILSTIFIGLFVAIDIGLLLLAVSKRRKVPVKARTLISTPTFCAPVLLLIFRVLAAFFCLGVLIDEIVVQGWSHFQFFTVVSFTFLTLYFFLVTAFSSAEVIQQIKYGVSTSHKELAGLLGHLTTHIFVMAGSSAVMVAISVWAYLVPYAYAKLKEGVYTPADMTLFFFNFRALNMHITNVVLVLVEILFAHVPFEWSDAGYPVGLTLVWVIVIWILKSTGSLAQWPYPMMDWDAKFAPLLYVGALIFPIVAFMLLLGLRLLARRFACYGHVEEESSGPIFDWKSSVYINAPEESTEASSLLPADAHMSWKSRLYH